MLIRLGQTILVSSELSSTSLVFLKKKTCFCSESCVSELLALQYLFGFQFSHLFGRGNRLVICLNFIFEEEKMKNMVDELNAINLKLATLEEKLAKEESDKMVKFHSY